MGLLADIDKYPWALGVVSGLRPGEQNVPRAELSAIGLFVRCSRRCCVRLGLRGAPSARPAGRPLDADRALRGSVGQAQADGKLGHLADGVDSRFARAAGPCSPKSSGRQQRRRAWAALRSTCRAAAAPGPRHKGGACCSASALGPRRRAPRKSRLACYARAADPGSWARNHVALAHGLRAVRPVSRAGLGVGAAAACALREGALPSPDRRMTPRRRLTLVGAAASPCGTRHVALAMRSARSPWVPG